MKTQWTEEEIRAAIVEGPLADVIMGKLKTRQIRDDCPVVFNTPSNRDLVDKASELKHYAQPTNVCALISLAEAHGIAHRAISRHAPIGNVEDVMREVDEGHDAYKYGDEQG